MVHISTYELKNITVTVIQPSLVNFGILKNTYSPKKKSKSIYPVCNVVISSNRNIPPGGSKETKEAQETQKKFTALGSLCVRILSAKTNCWDTDIALCGVCT